jgi:hypothetical protein
VQECIVDVLAQLSLVAALFWTPPTANGQALTPSAPAEAPQAAKPQIPLAGNVD